MIVAANSQSNETLCIPLSSMMGDIQDCLDLTHLPELPLQGDGNISMAISSGEYDHSTETDDESSDVERLEIIESHLENGDPTVRDDYLDNEDSFKLDTESQNRSRSPRLSFREAKAARSSVLVEGKNFNLRKITPADLSEVVRDQLGSNQPTYILVETPNLDREKEDTSLSPGHEQQSRRKKDHSGSDEHGTDTAHVGEGNAFNRTPTAEPNKVPEEPIDPATVEVAIASRNLDHQFEASLRDLLMEAGCDVQLARDIMKAHAEKEEEIRQASLALPKRATVRQGSEPKMGSPMAKSNDGPKAHDRGSQMRETGVSPPQIEAKTQRKASAFAAIGGTEVERPDEDVIPDRGSRLKQKRLVYDRVSSHLVFA